MTGRMDLSSPRGVGRVCMHMPSPNGGPPRCGNTSMTFPGLLGIRSPGSLVCVCVFVCVCVSVCVCLFMCVRERERERERESVCVCGSE